MISTNIIIVINIDNVTIVIIRVSLVVNDSINKQVQYNTIS